MYKIFNPKTGLYLDAESLEIAKQLHLLTKQNYYTDLISNTLSDDDLNMEGTKIHMENINHTFVVNMVKTLDNGDETWTVVDTDIW